MNDFNRRQFMQRLSWIAGSFTLAMPSMAENRDDVLKGVQTFIHRIAKNDGTFQPGIDP